MVVSSADKAVSNANAAKNCDPGYCLKYVRTWLGIASKEADAADAWHNATGKHKGDKSPPKGAPVFWTGGTNGHGHIAIVRNADMRSTDIPSSGKVGNDDGSWPRKHWGLTYVGWAEGFNGVKIPWLASAKEQHAKYAKGDVYVSKLKKGQQNSDSVSRLRYRLMTDKDIPDGKRPGWGPVSGGADYGGSVVDCVKWWQRNLNNQGGNNDGTNMTNAQANQIFGDNYKVHEE